MKRKIPEADSAAPSLGVRLVSMNTIRQQMCPSFFSPVPCAPTLRAWLNAARITKFKSNPSAKRGGGRTYYRAAEVERWLRQRAGI